MQSIVSCWSWMSLWCLPPSLQCIHHLAVVKIFTLPPPPPQNIYRWRCQCVCIGNESMCACICLRSYLVKTSPNFSVLLWYLFIYMFFVLPTLWRMSRLHTMARNRQHIKSLLGTNLIHDFTAVTFSAKLVFFREKRLFPGNPWFFCEF